VLSPGADASTVSLSAAESVSAAEHEQAAPPFRSHPFFLVLGPHFSQAMGPAGATSSGLTHRRMLMSTDVKAMMWIAEVKATPNL
jgi:hypothetical protein